MKVLVYGVGAIGSLLIHYLCESGNDVTVVARSTYEELKEKGLVIEHYIQKKTTVDHPTIVKEADMTEKYDIVFSVLQGQQQKPLLDIFCKLNSELIVLIGNNMESEYCETYINEHKVSPRNVVFGFSNSAGHREGGKTVSGRLPNTTLHIGGLKNAADPKDFKLINDAFKTGVKVVSIDDMYSYYLYHVATIMPFVYLCYRLEYNLKAATAEDINMVMDATKEGYDYLKSLGVKVMPPNEDDYYEGGLKKKVMYLFYRIIVCKTSLGCLMVSDHCQNGIEELKYLDEIFNDEFRKNHPGKDMPKWDEMRQWSKKAFDEIQ